ncbi:MAG: hypothetical protein LH606_00185 [Cytophagaceae bacterium]|nr:hypothetical protein [Cytophagaceae bacterium]
MKMRTLLTVLFLMIGLCTEVAAMGYPHRLFGSKRSTVKVMPQASRRGVTAAKAPVALRSGWHLPGVGNLVRVLVR